MISESIDFMTGYKPSRSFKLLHIHRPCPQPRNPLFSKNTTTTWSSSSPFAQQSQKFVHSHHNPIQTMLMINRPERAGSKTPSQNSSYSTSFVQLIQKPTISIPISSKTSQSETSFLQAEAPAQLAWQLFTPESQFQPPSTPSIDSVHQV
jgi:hypothetical protein